MSIGRGGGIALTSGGQASLTNTTVDNNIAQGTSLAAGGGIHSGGAGESTGMDYDYHDGVLVRVDTTTWAGNPVAVSGGSVSGNTAHASGAGSAGYGGGIHASDSLTITADAVTQTLLQNNRATTKGGAVFMDAGSLLGAREKKVATGNQIVSDVTTLRPVALNIITGGGDIVFSGNRHGVADASLPYNAADGTANAVYFGSATGTSQSDAVMTISGTGLLQMEDPIEVNLNNGKSFTLTKGDTSYFNWGGANVLDAAGGSTVTLGAGTQFYSGFSLDNGGVNTNANVILNLTGDASYYQVARPAGDTGDPSESFSFSNTTLNLTNNARLVPYGTLILGDNTILNAAAGSGLDLESGAVLRASGNSQINGAALVIDAGKTLAVDMGKTLTLGSGSTLALSNGILSFGVGAGNTSGLIDMTAAASAPTFSGSNTLDISEWIAGTYTVLQAGSAIAGTALGTFQTFTVGGLTPGAGVTLTPSLGNSGRDLVITAALNQDSTEKIWGGTAGTWNYTNTNWKEGVTAGKSFVLGDLATFDGTGAISGLAVTVGTGASSQVETAGMSITGGSYTFSGGKIMGRTDISQGSVIAPTGRLDIAGSGNIVFNNAVDFSGGLWVAGGSSANVTLADYTGGRVLLGTDFGDYAGTFSGKLHIQNQTRSGAIIQGGGLLSYNAGTSGVSILNGSLIAGNSLDAQGAAATAAMGGGLKSLGSISLLAGEISGNSASATNTGGTYAEAYGGGLQAVGSITTLSGTISGNTATAQASAGRARAFGGGVDASNIASLSGEISGNKAEATATGGATEATALGGGALLSIPAVSISKGIYADNQAIATGTNARAQGGALFLVTTTPSAPASLTLDPTAGAITFSGNSVTVNSVTQANAIHFGRTSLASSSSGNASLAIQDSGNTGNLITIADGVTTDISNGKTFTLAQSGGEFLWGGPNLFDSAGGDTVSLTGGNMRLANGFILDRGAVNGGTGLLAFNVTGGNLKSEGTAASLNNTALSVSSGGKLTVDLGSTLTLDANSTFALNGGILSFGVGAGNASGKIALLGSAATFTGSSTLNISEWRTGTYTILSAAADMGLTASSLFSNFTAGDNPLSGDNAIRVNVVNGGRDIQIQAALSRDNAEMIWGGASGAWNYTAQNWKLGAETKNFLPKDAALFDSTGAADQTVTLGGTHIELSGLKVTGGANYTLTGGALHIDSDGHQNLSALTYQDKLVMDGTGILTLTTGSAANPNRINTIELNSGNLKLGGGFALAPVSGRGTFTKNGGMLELAGAVSISDYDLSLPGAFYIAPGSTLTLADSTLDKNSVALSMEDGSTLVSAGAYNTLNNTSLTIRNGGALEMRGNSVLTVAHRPFSIISLAGGTATWRAGDNQLRLGSGGSLGLGVLDVDLNRSQTLAAIDVTGGTLALDQSTLRLRHTGLADDAGSWLLVDGAYTGAFSAVDIATATLTGTVSYEVDQILFDGSYTVAGGADGVFPGYSSLPPNARNVWAGFRDAFYNGRTPFMDALDQAYGSPAAFQADLLNMMPYMPAEGAVSQGIQALFAHNAAAMAAFGYAFGNDALASAQSFAPLAFQAPNTLGFNIGSQNRRDQARATGRYADRMASLDGNIGFERSSYSVLGNWQPATDMTRNLVASASPEFTLNAAGANTPFGVRMWGGYLGNFAHQDNKGGYAGYDADQNGFLLGGSFDITPNWTAGAYVGWTTGDTRYNGIKTRIDTDATHVGAFARYRREAGPGTAKVTGDILYSFTDNDSRRTVPTALGNQHMKGSFDQNIIGGGLEAAYDWKPSFDENLVITPYLAGRYAHLEQDGFTESGNLGLKVGKTDADSFTTTVGVKAARDFHVSDTVILTPKATVGWLHQWADRDVAANSSFIGSPVTFMTRSVKQDADAALVGAGLDVLVKTGQSWDLGLKLGYGAEIRQNSNDQTVFVGFEVKF
ncbi:hypothetical protein KL86DPRO_60234 [uncultured delta proteobacterium]|uniref:Autotransporter domain-containing protein n=1 Tax=uncultured delta proteobacterium TaxID=34034 RepID=A0A212KG03_9DELT|nr:hypothetical protein KL86DPRO_60234 [uncultured delta proteobacterium]